MLSVIAVAMAAIAYVATSDRDSGEALRPVSEPAASTAAPSPSPTAKPSAKPTRKPRPPLKRGQVFVEVFNNSGITGLASRTASEVTGAGWNVVGTGNWYGTIPSTTVYYPKRLEDAGKALGRDLGISRVLPAVEPMQFDRLTVILTSDRG